MTNLVRRDVDLVRTGGDAVSLLVLQGAGSFCLGKDCAVAQQTTVSASHRFRFVPVLDIIMIIIHSSMHH